MDKVQLEGERNVKLHFYCIEVGNENFNVSVPISGIPMSILKQRYNIVQCFYYFCSS